MSSLSSSIRICSYSLVIHYFRSGACVCLGSTVSYFTTNFFSSSIAAAHSRVEDTAAYAYSSPFFSVLFGYSFHAATPHANKPMPIKANLNLLLSAIFNKLIITKQLFYCTQ